MRREVRVDNPVLVVEAPILNDETAVKVFRFLQRLADTFEVNYYTQLERYYRKNNDFYYVSRSDHHINEAHGDQRVFDDEIPF
jgi:hypothetical protein